METLATANSVPVLDVVVPAYQAESHIEASLLRLCSTLDENFPGSYRIIVVSDGSTDTTEARVTNIAKSQIELVVLDRNRGKGEALREGFRRTRAPLVGQIDADLDIHPESLVRLVQIIEASGADVAIGSKVHPASSVQYPLLRRIQSQVFRSVTRSLFSLSIHDTQTGVKVYRQEVVRSIVDVGRESGFAFDLEALVIAQAKGYGLVEGPVNLDYHFSSTVPVTAALTMLRDSLKIWWWSRRAS